MHEPVTTPTRALRASVAVLLLLAQLALPCSGQEALTATSLPPGAAALGYTRVVIDERPSAADIAPGRTGAYPWFSGQWWAKAAPGAEHYEDIDGALALRLGGDLVSAPSDFSAGKLPLLRGSKGFYVEVDVRLSSNDPDHFPALWLMPAEHNAQRDDRYAGDPPGFERWMELDVDEGGFGPGLTGTVHSWTGVHPHYRNTQNGNNVSSRPLDRQQRHTFGASYEPRARRVTWYVDGVAQMSAGPPHVPEIAAQQNFYLIISAQSHGANKPYRMWIEAVRAFAPPD